MLLGKFLLYVGIGLLVLGCAGLCTGARNWK